MSYRSMRNKPLKKVTFAEQISYDDDTKGILKSLNSPEERESSGEISSATMVVFMEPSINATMDNDLIQIRYLDSSPLILPALNLELEDGNDSPYGHSQTVGNEGCCIIS